MNLALFGFVIAGAIALWPIWPAWVQLAAIPAVLLSGVVILSLLLHLIVENPIRHPLTGLAPVIGWVVAVNAAGEHADSLGWASSFIVMFVAGYIARLCLSTYSRRRAGIST